IFIIYYFTVFYQKNNKLNSLIMSHSVFISYAKENESVAYSICKALESEDIKCWIAPRDILPGVSYPKAIITAIKSSTRIILVLSKYSNRSKHVMRELERALINDIQIVPIKIEDVTLSEEMEYFISTTQWLDASSSPIGSYVPQLIKSITSEPKTLTPPSDSAHSKLNKPNISKLDDVDSLTEAVKSPTSIRGEVLNEMKSLFSKSGTKSFDFSKKKIFLSYHIADKEILKIEEIEKRLQSYEKVDTVLYSLKDHEKQEKYYDKIIKLMRKNIEKCDVLLLFCTANTLKSPLVEKEWRTADNLKKPIILIYSKEEHIPPLLQYLYPRMAVEFDFFNTNTTVSNIFALIIKLFKNG
ncbi:MAG: toll/interleukin-1 receptor domain-containing protein, partial [Promethearchaeota archaeon]